VADEEPVVDGTIEGVDNDAAIEFWA